MTTDIDGLVKRLRKRAEACRLTANYMMADEFNGYADALSDADRRVAEEREACAKICDEWVTIATRWRSNIGDYNSHEATSACTQRDTSQAIASAIRSRSNDAQPDASGALQLGAARQEPGVVVAHQHGAANDPAPLSHPSPAPDGWQLMPRTATDSMCGYAKHRHPEISREQARGIWFTMAEEAIASPPAPSQPSPVVTEEGNDGVDASSVKTSQAIASGDEGGV
ncbi:MAG: hypothetical protein WC807_18580 [Hyphomicrobium sp.]